MHFLFSPETRYTNFLNILMKKMRTKIYLLIMPVLFLSVIREDIKKSRLKYKFICTSKTNKTQLVTMSKTSKLKL